MPYRTAAGPVLLHLRFTSANSARSTFDDAAATRNSDHIHFPILAEISAGSPIGPWRAFAELELTQPADSSGIGPFFDPVLHQVPELGTYEWARRLREKSYRAARHSRGASLDTESK
jgi:hypothetical protein